MKVVKESFSIDTSQPGFVHIQHVRVYDDGIDMGGPMWFERANKAWVADALRTCLDTYASPEASLQRGDDSLSVNESGPEQEPVFHLRNRRPRGGVHGGAFRLGMSRAVAERLVRELQAIR